MTTVLPAGSGKLNYKVALYKGQGCRQAASWVSAAALKKDLSWSRGVSKLLQLHRCSSSSSLSQTTKQTHHRTAITLCLGDTSSTRYFDFAVIGSGVAGLRYALEVSKHGSVAVITKAEPHESNTNYAQGGVSAGLCPSDSVESHMQDTIFAGAYLCDEDTVRVRAADKSLIFIFNITY